MKTKPKWRTREIWWCTAHDHQTDNDGPQGYWSYQDSEVPIDPDKLLGGLVTTGRVTPCDIVAGLLVLDREAE